MSSWHSARSGILLIGDWGNRQGGPAIDSRLLETRGNTYMEGWRTSGWRIPFEDQESSGNTGRIRIEMYRGFWLLGREGSVSSRPRSRLIRVGLIPRSQGASCQTAEACLGPGLGIRRIECFELIPGGRRLVALCSRPWPMGAQRNASNVLSAATEGLLKESLEARKGPRTNT